VPSILITAFEPYGPWQSNSSWLCLQELTRDLPATPIVTRRYPVDFVAARQRLEADLERDFDVALHLGQAPGSSRIHLETFAINAAADANEPAENCRPLCADGPAAYRSALPLARWSGLLREAGIPAALSMHAGTYLCNATLYWTHYVAQRRGLKTQAAFIHLPLETSQVVSAAIEKPSMAASMTAQALRLILDDLEFGAAA
jgi:pyroglutamyl-peptidase